MSSSWPRPSTRPASHWMNGRAQAVEDVKRKGGIAQPAEPVVPVALSADMLRKRGSDGGADGAGGYVEQEVERQHRALHQLLPAAHVAPVVGDEAPEGLRPSQPTVDVVVLRQRRGLIVPAQEERRPLAFLQAEAGAGASIDRLQRRARGQGQTVLAVARHGRPSVHRDRGVAAAVVHAGTEVHLHLHGAALTAHDPQHLVGALRDLFRHGHEVREADRAAFRLEAGHEYVALGKVRVVVPELSGGPYAEVTTVDIVNDGRENARRIESREAEPV